MPTEDTGCIKRWQIKTLIFFFCWETQVPGGEICLTCLVMLFWLPWPDACKSDGPLWSIMTRSWEPWGTESYLLVKLELRLHSTDPSHNVCKSSGFLVSLDGYGKDCKSWAGPRGMQRARWEEPRGPAMALTVR